MTAPRTPASGALIGVIDIGTNAVKLVVGSVANDRVETVHFGRRPTRLGEGLAATGRIRRDAAQRTAVAVRALAAEARAAGATDILAGGTHALRAAANGRDVARMIAGRSAVPVRILSAKREGGLVLRAVQATMRRPARHLMVVDIGGGSAQLSVAAGGRAPVVRSVPLGAVVLTEHYLHRDPVDAGEHARMAARVDAVLARLFATLPSDAPGSLVLCGGAAATALRMLGVPRSRAMPSVSLASLRRLQSACLRATTAQRRHFAGMTPDRADIMPAALAVLIAFARHARARSVRVFEGGWREGLIRERATPARRSRRKTGSRARTRAAARRGR